MSHIDWIMSNCRSLDAIGREFEQTRPFANMTIGSGIHLEAKVVPFLLALRRGGARVIATGNLGTTQEATVDYLAANGIEVIGGPTRDADQRLAWITLLLGERPDLLVDNGGDMYLRWLAAPYDSLIGGTEHTGSGRKALEPLREALARPILVIDDSPVKQFVDDRHAVGQSTVESFLRLTNLATNGRRVVVVGYGRVGRGLALNFRNNHARVAVLEVDPVLRLEALWDGFGVPDRQVALSTADIVITATGTAGVIGPPDLEILPDGAVILNVGHLPVEIDVPGMTTSPLVADAGSTDDGIATLRLHDGRSIHILADGQMVNLAGPRPIGNSIEAMDIGFSLHARSLEAIAAGQVGPGSCVAPVPRTINEQVAREYLGLTAEGRTPPAT